MSVIFFRADGRKALGMGHLARSLTLADALGEAWGVDTRLIVGEDPAARQFLAARGVEALWLARSTDEVAFLGRLAAQRAGAPFVFDVLDPRAFEPSVRAVGEAGSPTLVVCDVAEVPESSADVLLSGHLSLGGSPDPRLMLGPGFFLLEPRLAAAVSRAPGAGIERLAVTLGGSDHEDLTGRVVDALSEVAPGLAVDVAMSRASGGVEALLARARRSTLDLRLHLDPIGLTELWSVVDGAVTAGGNSLFERVACRLPGATLCQTALQHEHAREMAARGVNVDLGLGREVSDATLRRRLARFLADAEGHRSQYLRSPGVIDLGGTERVRERLEALGFASGVTRCTTLQP